MRIIIGAFLVACLAPLLTAQTPTTAPAPRFDVVSIKINNSGAPGAGWDDRCDSGRWTARNLDVATLIATAYSVAQSQVRGVPDWNLKPLHRYQIVATCRLGRLDQPPMVDETGLAGKYDFDFEYEVIPKLKDADGHPVDQQYKMLKAMRDQLGLIYNQSRLRKMPTQVLVVDRIAPPTPN